MSNSKKPKDYNKNYNYSKGDSFNSRNNGGGYDSFNNNYYNYYYHNSNGNFHVKRNKNFRHHFCGYKRSNIKKDNHYPNTFPKHDNYGNSYFSGKKPNYGNEVSRNKETTCVTSKNNESLKNDNSLVLDKVIFTSCIFDSLNKSNNEQEIIQEDPLFEDIKQKLNNASEYKQEDLIKDMKILISKNAFIKEA